MPARGLRRGSIRIFTPSKRVVQSKKHEEIKMILFIYFRFVIIRFIDEDGIINTKKLYICLIEGKYFVKHYNSTDNIKECKYYSLQKMKRYVSEGANFLLMRYMAITRFVGPLEMSCAYINGDMCLNVYVN